MQEKKKKRLKLTEYLGWFSFGWLGLAWLINYLAKLNG